MIDSYIARLAREQQAAKDKAEAERVAALNASNAALQAQNQAQTGGNFVKSSVMFDAAGRPITQDYETVRGTDGNLLGKYTIDQGEDVTADTLALQKLQKEALSDSPSVWANMQLEALATKQAIGQDDLAKVNANSATQAANQMAATGGVSAAQRMRLATQGSRAQLLGQAGLARQGMLDQQNILADDAQNKTSMLSTVQGLQNNTANLALQNKQLNTNIQAQNIGNMLQDVQGLNAYNAGNYKEAMSGWAAEKSANAQAQAARGGGKK